jgi:hypothetical protein
MKQIENSPFTSFEETIYGTQMRRQTIMKAYKAMLKTELKLSIKEWI